MTPNTIQEPDYCFENFVFVVSFCFIPARSLGCLIHGFVEQNNYMYVFGHGPFVMCWVLGFGPSADRGGLFSWLSSVMGQAGRACTLYSYSTYQLDDPQKTGYNTVLVDMLGGRFRQRKITPRPWLLITATQMGDRDITIYLSPN